VGLRYEITLNVDGQAVWGAGADHEERAEELTALAAVEPCVAAAQAVRADTDRRAAGAGDRNGVDAALLERVEERLDGALAHPFDAVEDVLAAAQRKERGQEADGRPRVADKERRRPRGDRASSAGNREGAVLPRSGDVDPERVERCGHVVRVVAEERAADDRGAVRKGGDRERAVGVALRPRHRDLHIDRCADRLDLDLVGVPGRLRHARGPIYLNWISQLYGMSGEFQGIRYSSGSSGLYGSVGKFSREHGSWPMFLKPWSTPAGIFTTMRLSSPMKYSFNSPYVGESSRMS